MLKRTTRSVFGHWCGAWVQKLIKNQQKFEETIHICRKEWSKYFHLIWYFQQMLKIYFIVKLY
jgi:hypothetical protein